ncbi:NYN domain-containing protein [Cellulomonas soli]|uniref:NYN domain-containing protein n=1 Tax=Cellulomonas soli TaxID=931535 RepID=UPI003F833DA5
MTLTDVPTRTDDDRRLRAALFVDFDNVYLGLRRLDPTAAEAFATNPGHWLDALEQGADSQGQFTRRFLVRACYLNPSAFSQYRPNFTRAGFRVVDCPSLTQQGKSSADINLVLDAVDALVATTRYEEFVIVSADADFTPLVQRCRAADRRVTIITASPAAAAYRAVADTVVGADALAELVTATDAVPESDVVPLSPPTAAVPADPAATSVPRPRTGKSAPAPTAEPPAAVEPVVAPAVVTAPTAGALAARRAVLQRVRAADRPLPLGSVAQVAQAADPTLPGSGWGGPGGFTGWLGRSVPELGLATKPSPGYVWDPKRFDEADLPGAVTDVDADALRRQVVAVTDTPGLTTDGYRVLLKTLAHDIATHPFERIATTRRVREACQKAGAQVGRATVNFVISGISYSGVELTTARTAKALAEAWADNVVGLCRGARMELSRADVAAIRAWVGGGLLAP